MDTPAPQESVEERAIAELQPSGAPVVPPGIEKTGFSFGQRQSPFFDSRKVGDILNKTAAVTTDPNAAAQAPKTAPAPEAPVKTEAPAQAPAEKASETPAQPAEQEASGTLPEEKLDVFPDVDLSRLPGFKVEGTPDDVDSIKRIVEKYSGDPDKLANALLHHQRFQSSRDRELVELRHTVEDLRTRITEPQEDEGYEDEYEDERPPVRQRDTRGRFQARAEREERENVIDAKAEIKAIKERVKSEEIDMAEALDLIADVQERAAIQREEMLKAELRNDLKKQEQAREEATVEQVNFHNARIYHDRARAILAEQASRQGQSALAEKYKSPEYELSEDEYRVAQPRLMKEFEHINKHYRVPSSGMISMQYFERASRELDPKSYEQQIRLDERRKTLGMIKQGTPTGTHVDSGSGIAASRTTVGGPKPPATATDYVGYQQWYLTLPPEERARVRKERGLN